MKYFYLCIFLFLFSVPFITSASPQVYIYPVATQKASYDVGETIVGQFTIHNVMSNRQSDVLYSIAVSVGNEAYGGMLVGEKKSDIPLYLEANSKRVIPFEYKIPESISGKVHIVVTGYLTDGTIVAQGNAPILIKGEAKNKLLQIRNAFIIADNVQYEVEEAPFVSSTSSAKLVIQIPSTSSETITAKTFLYNRTQIGDPLLELDSVQVTTKEDSVTEISIPLPSDIDPLVYAGTVFFESENFEIAPLSFRYVVPGPIATIRNINSNKLSISKKEKFAVHVEYAGTPIAEAQEQGIELEKAILKLRVVNEKNEQVSQVEQEIDLVEQTSVTFELRSEVSAKNLNIEAQIIDSEGKILSTFTTELPSQNDLDSWYQNSFFKKNIIVISLVSLIIITLSIFLIFRKNRNKKLQTSSLLSVLILIGAFGLFTQQLVAQVSSGYQIESGWVDARSPELTALFSPLPPSVRTYQPGEYFDIVGNVRYGRSLAVAANIYSYIPKRDPFSPSKVSQTNPDNWTQASIDHDRAWWNHRPPEEKFNQPIVGFGAFTTGDSLFKWVNDNYSPLAGTWAVNSYGNNVGGNYVNVDNLVRNITNPLNNLRNLVYAKSSVKVFSNAMTLGYMIDSLEFDRDFKLLLGRNTLGQTYSSCLLRHFYANSADCPTGVYSHNASGVMMRNLFPPRNIAGVYEPQFQQSKIQNLVLVSKFRSYEQNKDEKPFAYEISNEGSISGASYARGYLWEDPVRTREFYKESAVMLALVAEFMRDYQISGWQDANSFNFGAVLVPSSNEDISKYVPSRYTVTYNESIIDAIAVAEYNSAGFNQALKSILNFLYYYNERYFNYSIDYSQARIDASNIVSNSYTTFHSRITSQGFDSAPYYSYFIPPKNSTEKLYLYMFLNNYDGANLHSKELLVSQPVRIQDTASLTCPNLISPPEYTQDENGVIYEDGTATSLVKDGLGNCVEPDNQCSPEVDPVDLGQSCGCNNVGTINCSGNCVDSEGASVSPCSALSLSCSASPSPAKLVEGSSIQVTFTANAQQGTQPYVYEWFSDSLRTVPVSPACTGSQCQRTYTNFGPKYIYLKVSDSSTSVDSQNAQCFVTVDDGTTGPSSGEVCIDNIWHTRVDDGAGNITNTPIEGRSLCRNEPQGSNGPQLTSFTLSPGIVPTSNQSCGLGIHVTGVTSCRIFDRNNTVVTYITDQIMLALSGGVINTTSNSNRISVPIGSYTLGCSGVNSLGQEVSELFGNRSCILNPSVQEF